MIHTLRRTLPLLILPIGLAGCSSTKGNRLALAPDYKTIASVGDQPIVAVTGEPGDSTKTELPNTPSRENPKTRISGRVVDTSGEPVANATVRLADGSSVGGKVIEATTDRAGGFTLRGLRPNTRYTLIAERDDGRVVMSGRVEAKTASSNVEIGLNDNDPDAPPAAKPPRPRSVSSRDPDDPEDGEPVRIRRRINEEDLPPADPAEALPTRSVTRKPDAAEGRRKPEAGWVSPDGRTISPSPAGSKDDPDPADARASRLLPEEEDVPNPLPPALDPNESAALESGSEVRMTSRTSDRAPPAQEGANPATAPRFRGAPAVTGRILGEIEAGRPLVNEEETAQETPVAVMPGSMAPAAPIARAVSKPVGPAAPRADREEVPPAVEAVADRVDEEGENPLPPAIEATPAAPAPPSQPVLASAPPAEVPPPDMQAPSAPSESVPPPAWVTDSAGDARTERVATQDPAPRPVDDSTSTPEPNTNAPAAGARSARITWAQLASMEMPQPSRMESDPGSISDRVSRSSEAPRNSKLPPVDRDLPAGSPAPDRKKAVVAAAAGARPQAAVVSYDPRARRVTELALPDLQGQTVRLSDFDSEYILLDFWGTWCKPCLNSIPKLIELQRKLGPEKIQIVGIACEDVPVAQRPGKVAEVAERMNINYAVLLSGMDGKPCPVQQALGVQAYPTMVLLDRKGNVVWRDSGNSAQSLSRLDRIVQSGSNRVNAGVARR